MRNGKILVIGIGNEFRRDDGVGHFIAGEIKKNNCPGARVLEHRGEGVDLMEEWRGFETVILFDAVSSGAAPGTVRRFEIPGETVPRSLFCCSTHAINISDVIELAKTLDRLPKRLIVYGVEGKSFAMGPGLSPEVREAARKVVEQAAGEILSSAGKG